MNIKELAENIVQEAWEESDPPHDLSSGMERAIECFLYQQVNGQQATAYETLSSLDALPDKIPLSGGYVHGALRWLSGPRIGRMVDPNDSLSQEVLELYLGGYTVEELYGLSEAEFYPFHADLIGKAMWGPLGDAVAALNQPRLVQWMEARNVTVG